MGERDRQRLIDIDRKIDRETERQRDRERLRDIDRKIDRKMKRQR